MLRRVAATNPASNAIRAPRAAAIHPNFSVRANGLGHEPGGRVADTLHE